jgi:hypothetical protein
MAAQGESPARSFSGRGELPRAALARLFGHALCGTVRAEGRQWG